MTIIDAHVHAIDGGTQAVDDLLRLERDFGYAACCFQSCECMGDAAQNALGLYLKKRDGASYAFGGLSYRRDMDIVQEARTLLDMGFDGMKMVENKPTIRQALGIPLNDARYDGFYALLQARGAPLMCHVGDPEEFWDAAAIPAWAKASGWDYSAGGFAEKEQLYREAEDVLLRFPGLPVIFAHCFFLSADMERLDALLCKYPAMCIDLTAGSEMYFNFAGRVADWRSFFIKHQNRVLFGTDNCNIYSENDLRNARETNRMEIAFLSEKGDIPVWDRVIQGAALPCDVQKKILGGNFQRLAGPHPKPVDADAACAYLKARLGDAGMALTAREAGVTRDVLAALRTGDCA